MKQLHRLDRIEQAMKEVFDQYAASLTMEERWLRLRELYSQKKTASERNEARRRAEALGIGWIYDDNWREELAARQSAGRIR